jgi:hypothetical protein
MRQKQEFLLSLLKDNDWSMIIKGHALIETLATDLIIAATEEDKLKSVMERLPLSDEQFGKLKIAKDYELLSPEQRSFVRRLSALRNNLVHKYENLDFDLKTYVASFDEGQRKSWQNYITWYATDDDTKQKWQKISIQNPKLGVWFAVFMFVSLIILDKRSLIDKKRINDLAGETTSRLLKEKDSSDKIRRSRKRPSQPRRREKR